MTGVIYARYSCENQREESIEGQLRECKEYAKSKGVTIVKTYIDRAISGTTDKRPGFQQMIYDSYKKTFDVILVWKLDRFARSRDDSAKYRCILRNNNVKLISVTEHISSDPLGIILESMIEGYNEYYSAELSQKVKRGMKENALKCQYNGGGVAYGFVIDKDKHYQPDPLKAQIVVDIFKKYDEGNTINDILKYLKEKEIYYNKDKYFSINNLTYMLKNRRYIGYYIYRDIVKENAITPIVDKELFDRVQEKLSKNAKAPARHKAEDDYVLTTKLFCGKCGKYMVGESGTGNNGTVYHYYKCVNTKKKHKCDMRNIKKQLIEDNVIKHTLDMLSDDKLLDKIADKMITCLNKENTNLKLLNKQLHDVEKKIDNILDAIEKGIITGSTKSRLEKLEDEKNKLAESIDIEKANNIPITKEQILYWFSNFKDLDMKVLRNRQFIVDTFINSIYLYDDKLTITYNIENKTEELSLKDIESSDMELIGEP